MRRVTPSFLAILLLPLSFAMTALAAPSPQKKLHAQAVELFRDFHGAVPGASALVVLDGRVLLKKSFGLSDLEGRKAAGSGTAYRLASVSKQFTATAILLLVQQGRLALTDPLTKFFPQFPVYGREIQVRHLLSHSSGLLAYEELMPAGATVPLLDADVLALLARQDRT
jgi:CubicO group peptidase (beta-lactamase class C family)